MYSANRKLRGVQWDAVFQSYQFTSQTKHHLVRVYGTLAYMVAAAVAGAMLHLWYNVGGLLSIVGAVVALFGALASSAPGTKVAFAGLFGLLFGASQGS